MRIVCSRLEFDAECHNNLQFVACGYVDNAREVGMVELWYVLWSYLKGEWKPPGACTATRTIKILFRQTLRNTYESIPGRDCTWYCPNLINTKSFTI